MSVSALAVAIGSIAAPAQAEDPLKYVAVGDSYAAGTGTVPLDLSAPACARSTHNYPSVIEAELGVTNLDVTCANAETKHFTTAQHPMGAGPQFDAITADTDLVTVTIGGNDNATFVNVLQNCGIASAFTFGFGSPCKAQYGNSFVNDIQTKTAPAVMAVVAGIRERAPHATIAVVGYPWLAPSGTGCWPFMPIARGDVTYVQDIQRALNTAMSTAAAASGAVFVDMLGPSTGHDPCQAIGTRWVEPAITGLNFIPAHPNWLGSEAMAAETLEALGLG